MSNAYLGTELWQKSIIHHICFPYLARRIKIFSYFNSLLTENCQNSDSPERLPSPWKICVKPHSMKSKKNSHGRKILNTKQNTYSFSFKGHYPVYLYNDIEGKTLLIVGSFLAKKTIMP